MPWLRPTQMVRLYSKARRFNAFNTASRSASRMSEACFNCTARQVSSTSDEVMPWWMNRDSGPTCSATLVRKAMTSCLVWRSIASMRAISYLPLARNAFAALLGTVPSRAMASSALASISNQMR